MRKMLLQVLDRRRAFRANKRQIFHRKRMRIDDRLKRKEDKIRQRIRAIQKAGAHSNTRNSDSAGKSPAPLKTWVFQGQKKEEDKSKVGPFFFSYWPIVLYVRACVRV